MANRRLSMRLDYQKCRTWGHAWEDFIPGVGEKRAPAWGKRFSLRCVRCATERHDVFDALGELSTRHYGYPDDYQMAADERPALTQLRLSLVTELKEKTANREAGRRKVPRPVVKKPSSVEPRNRLKAL